MLRRFRLLPLVAATLLLAACGLVSDPDVVARVDDEELTVDELVDLIDGPDSTVTRSDAEFARQAISSWIRDRLPTESDPDQAAALYAQGLLVSRTLCSRLLVTTVEDGRDAAMDELADGEPWAEVHARYNMSAELASTGGALGCGVVQDYQSIGLAELFARLDAEQPFVTDAFDNGVDTVVYAVGAFIPYEELGPQETAQVIAGLPPDLTGRDIYVAPRYGTFDAAYYGVLPLG